jgi:hypothetical protein
LARSSLLKIIHTALTPRVLVDGGVVTRPGGRFQADATAWAILVLYGAGDEDMFALDVHRRRLMQEQSNDGRVSIDQEHPDSYWPTALAIIAWHNSLLSMNAKQRAVQFLLEAGGVHSPRRSNDPSGHDTSIRGWPWVSGTHSWIEPTALAVIALKNAGHGQHGRTREAVRMIANRQLPHGGWNYGNTVVFGRELHPMPESTGAALLGLAGEAERTTVARSLDYLHGEIDRLYTPISLGWGLLGLAAWNLWPSNGMALVERCLNSQSRYGPYDTSSLCLVLLGALAGQRKRGAGPLFPLAPSGG